MITIASLASLPLLVCPLHCFVHNMGSDLTTNNVLGIKNYIAKLPTESLLDIFCSSVPKARDWRDFREARKILYSPPRGYGRRFPLLRRLPVDVSLPPSNARKVFRCQYASISRIGMKAIEPRKMYCRTYSHSSSHTLLSVSFNLPYGLLSNRPYTPIFPAPFYNSSHLLELNIEKAPAYLGRYMQKSWSDLAKTLEATTCLEILEISKVECTRIDTSQHVILPFVKEFTVKHERLETIDAVSLLALPNVKSLIVLAKYEYNMANGVSQRKGGSHWTKTLPECWKVLAHPSQCMNWFFGDQQVATIDSRRGRTSGAVFIFWWRSWGRIVFSRGDNYSGPDLQHLTHARETQQDPETRQDSSRPRAPRVAFLVPRPLAVLVPTRKHREGPLSCRGTWQDSCRAGNTERWHCFVLHSIAAAKAEAADAEGVSMLPAHQQSRTL
ncbi:hypothetical protein B0H11DRAFT_1909580 [Mycena galericulata]|nr:hypothetical protein B0H11DRAFT_1909580 [Mycena galericulata]